MVTGQNNHSEKTEIADTPENFDKEYTLQELLPASVFELFYSDLKKLGIEYYCILLPDEKIYYQSDTVPDSSQSIASEALKSDSSRLYSELKLQQWHIAVFPIRYSLEVIGYLALGFDTRHQEKFPVEVIGSILLNAFIRMITANHKILLTSNLHGRVVEESFQELTEKNRLLEKSERQYRLLAEELELEVRKKAREIQETQTQLMHQEKMASIGQLSAGVAHEINNPMGFIGSNLKSLKKYIRELHQMIKCYQTLTAGLHDYSAPPERSSNLKQDLDRITNLEKELDLDFILEDLPALVDESLEGAERINKIVSDLKDFAHPGDETPTYADVNHCIDSTLNIVWNELKYKAKVHKAYGDLPMVYCYPRQLNQVFMNLLVNASHAIDTKGEIEITTRTADNHVEIIIKDTGAGIPENILPRIFDPFFTTKEVGKGTGLGLNLTYNIIKKHQGTIDVFSQCGQGTTFKIKLPIESDLTANTL